VQVSTSCNNAWPVVLMGKTLMTPVKRDGRELPTNSCPCLPLMQTHTIATPAACYCLTR
jgi:hypothetical protein